MGGDPRATRGGHRHEVDLLPSDAVPGPTGRLRGALRERLGHPAERRALRSGKVAQYYKWNLDELELADRLGYDGIGVNEHHQNAYGFMASPNLMAAAVARRTPNNSAILVLGNTLALYQPALRVAEEFAMLDCMTDGRLAAGFPVGTSMDVNRCYGITPTETRPRFYEAHDLIMKAWTQPPFPYNGRFNKLRYVNPWPQPLQKPHPPVWLAGGGSVETYEMAVNYDYTYSFLSFFGYQYAERVMDSVLGYRDRAGRGREPVSCRIRPADLRVGDRRQGGGGLPRARHVLLQEVPPHPALLLRDARATGPAGAPSSRQDEPARRHRRRARPGEGLEGRSSTRASSSPAARTRSPTPDRGLPRSLLPGTWWPSSRSGRCRTV